MPARQRRWATPFEPGHAERDACGIGFLADAEGRSSRAVVDDALEALTRVKHRGAVADDALTGDGAGVLLPLPEFVVEAHDATHAPVGIAMVFLPHGEAAAARALVEAACAAEHLAVVEWRRVPVDEAALGERARAALPAIEQAIVRPLRPCTEAVAERAAYAARRRAESLARAADCELYIASFSFRTVVYKALCAADQLSAFYGDLCDRRYRAWFALFHQRYSTNTAPSWARAQPFRLVAHNGEINTVRGNAARMKGRERDLGEVLPIAEELLRPVLDEAGSDSAMFDEALELLLRGGRSMEHAFSMLVPPAWERGASPEESAFFRYHSAVTEPWDGPAAMVFSDGRTVGAGLDRNGLRPLRLALCDDGFVACASEAGAVSTSGHGKVRRGRLGPGEIVVVDPRAGGVLFDGDVKKSLARLAPYGEWNDNAVRTRTVGTPLGEPGEEPIARQIAAGYSKEEITVVLRPMATEGKEPTSSMGDDTAQPGLAEPPRGVFGHLKQRFAQVTNPPIDHLRERHVMSLRTLLGARPPLLGSGPLEPLFEYETFIVLPSEVEFLLSEGAAALDATFDPAEGASGLENACRRLAEEAAGAVEAGRSIIVVSHRAHGRERVAVPSALAAGAVHHRLVAAGTRSRTSIVVDADDVREGHHCACLLTNGADAICPRLALEAIVHLAQNGRLGGDATSDEAQRRYVEALEESVLKVMSKMGIAVLDSYRGAQIIEAIGLAQEVVDICFTGMSSPLGGRSFEQLGRDALERRRAAFSARPVLVNTGSIKYRSGGEYHALNPQVVGALQEVANSDDAELPAAHALRRAVRGDDAAYEHFSKLVNERPPSEPRDLLDFVGGRSPVPIDEVEPVDAITRRFSTGAMSHGALSAEAHETLARAMNMIGGMANSGEGGEAPERFRTDRNCGIKQIASGRFGVTPDYVAFARELQIKMAQGSKPGEGGQLPGKKVTGEIAQLRHTVPGVALISPPPHHDIYSIEDLAQLIYDLRQANERAAISVKLVSSEGVGTIATGVVKALADVVHIAGGDGGTGASPLSSIKNAGLPWEVGLVDTQRALVAGGLRGRARIRVDGGLKTGRDVIIAALLGADEYSFGSAALVAEGCILVRTCHRDTCPVGIATQNPDLRAKFAGTPEMVARYLVLVAEEVRSLLARLGLRSLDDAIGRTDLLRARAAQGSFDVERLLPPVERVRRFEGAPLPKARSELGDRLYRDAMPALRKGDGVELDYEITTADRSVGARLGSALGLELGVRRPGAHVEAHFVGAAGQSFGAFLAEGIHFNLVGEANDYVGKGMAGGRIAIAAPGDDAGRPVLAGNTLLYGATGGQLFVAGRVGERFAVRNSGAVAVVEGTGDHACEYMTAGAVVILGTTGINFGAGMSGGEAYVLDEDGGLDGCLNPDLVAAYRPTGAQLESLKRVIAKHCVVTGSTHARAVLEGWDEAGVLFRRVAPKAEVARLEAMFEGTATSAA